MSLVYPATAPNLVESHLLRCIVIDDGIVVCDGLVIHSSVVLNILFASEIGKIGATLGK
jgi:hypothetical protein